jgi:hypothetical protein
MASATLNGFSMFGDEVYTSTDLNRRSGEVLNHARERPVTISRNNEQFALLRREIAAKLVTSVTKVQGVMRILMGVDALIAGREVDPFVEWLKVYDKDDLQKLCSEVLGATSLAVSGNADWNYVDAIIHEWRQSAIVAKSGLLDSVMYSEEADESELPSPEEVLSSTSCEPEVACATK